MSTLSTLSALSTSSTPSNLSTPSTLTPTIPAEVVRTLARKVHENWTADPLWVWSESKEVDTWWTYQTLRLFSNVQFITEVRITYHDPDRQCEWTPYCMAVSVPCAYERLTLHLWNQPQYQQIDMQFDLQYYFGNYPRFHGCALIQQAVIAQIINRLIAERIVEPVFF